MSMFAPGASPLHSTAAAALARRWSAPVAQRTPTRGFTLVESMVVIAVASILAVAAAPSFSNFMTGQIIKTTAYDLFGDLVFARSTAVKTNSPVMVSRAAGGWSEGWKVTWVDKTGTTVTLRSHATSGSATAMSASVDQFAFQRNGRLLAGTGLVNFTLDDSGAKQEIEARCIQVDTSGRPRSLLGACS